MQSGSLTKVLTASFGRPRTDRARLALVKPEKLWDIVLDQRAARTGNPVINAALGALYEAGLRDPLERHLIIETYASDLLRRHQSQNDWEKMLLIYRAVVPHDSCFYIEGQRYRGLTGAAGGLEVEYVEASTAMLNPGPLPREMIAYQTGRRGSCFELSCLLTALLRAAGLKAALRDAGEHSLVVVHLGETRYHLDPTNLTIEPNFLPATSERRALAVYYFQRGATYCELGKKTAAYSDFNEAVSIDPKLGEAWFGLGHLLDDAGEYRTAILAYDQAIEQNPFDPNFREAKLSTLMSQRHYMRGWLAWVRHELRGLIKW